MNQPARSMYPGSGALIDKISAALAKDEEVNGPVIPESLFVQMFLPFFAGNRVVEADELPAKWIGLAGSPFTAVRVFHDVTREILYTVPPFFDEGAFQVSNRKNGNINDMVKKVADLSLIHPNQGAAYFNKFINSLELLHDRKDESLRQMQAWMEIFKRYDIIPKDFQLPDGTAPVAAAVASTDNGVSQLNFDDADML